MMVVAAASGQKEAATPYYLLNADNILFRAQFAVVLSAQQKERMDGLEKLFYCKCVKRTAVHPDQDLSQHII